MCWCGDNVLQSNNSKILVTHITLRLTVLFRNWNGKADRSSLSKLISNFLDSFLVRCMAAGPGPALTNGGVAGSEERRESARDFCLTRVLRLRRHVYLDSDGADFWYTTGGLLSDIFDTCRVKYLVQK